MTRKGVASLSASLLKRGERDRSHGFVLGRPTGAGPAPQEDATSNELSGLTEADWPGTNRAGPPITAGGDPAPEQMLERGSDSGDPVSDAGRDEAHGLTKSSAGATAVNYSQVFPFDPFFGSPSDRQDTGGSPARVVVGPSSGGPGPGPVTSLEAAAGPDPEIPGPEQIVEALRRGERSQAERLLGKLAGLSETEVEQVLYGRGRSEMLAAACRFVGMEQLHFVSLFIMSRRGSSSTESVDAGDLEQAMGMFNDMNQEQAERLLITWRQQPRR